MIAGLSTWITVIWKPDGAHGMYSWTHVLLAAACAAVAWYSLYKAPEMTPRPPSGQYAIAWARRTTSRAWCECSASTGLALACRSVGSVTPDGQRRVGREQPAHDLGVAVAAVVQHDQQAGQAFHHVPAVVEEDLGHHHRAVAAHADQVAFPQLLLHLGHRHAEQSGDTGQVVDRFAGIQYVVGGRNAAHRTESKSQRSSR